MLYNLYTRMWQLYVVCTSRTDMFYVQDMYYVPIGRRELLKLYGNAPDHWTLNAHLNTT